jgi:hypothetical protein
MNKFLLILCLGLVSLTGCSRLDMAFRWADTYIASKVDDSRVALYFAAFMKDVEQINSYFSSTAVNFIASTV